jgi:hypothetical protein
MNTAVEFLVKEISDILGVIKIEPIKDLLLVDAINKAKEMEKEQIVEAFEIGYENGACVNEGDSIYYGSKYYKKTFNK